MVELHRDVADPCIFNFHIEGAWRQARSMTFHGIPAWQFSPEDEFLFLCLHAVRDQFSRLGVVLDVALATRLLAGGTERHLRPEVEKLTSHALLGYSIAKQCFPQLCVQVPLLQNPQQPHALAPLAAYLTDNLLTQANPYLSWAARRRLHVQLEKPGWHRLRLRWWYLGQMVRHVFVAELAERDFAFAGQWGLTRPWQARIVRPFRLAHSILLPIARPFKLGR